MDSFRKHPSEFDLDQASETPASNDVAAAIGTDERRMHVRAYNHWVSLLAGRDFPSIEDLEPGDVEDFAPHSVLLDFTCGQDNPALPYVGTAISDECALDEGMRRIADVPSRSLLSRLTDHYMQIIANRAPIGFEAEFENPAGDTICYRGILMPFSSDGETIDFIYGVINWKRVDTSLAAPAAISAPPAIDMPVELAENDAPPAPEMPELDATTGPAASSARFAWNDGSLDDDDPDAMPEITLDPDAGLADRLCAARETAESVKSGEGRTRAALYRALSLAFDFALAADDSPADYAELLEDSGVKAQARAPMTPIVKLVFGIDYDKARLTEFAAALSYARRERVASGDFAQFIEQQPGGLKALVAAERRARRPDTPTENKSELARARLRAAPPISLAELPADEEFALVVTRRGADGRHEPVAVLGDAALLDRAIRRAI